MPTAHEFESFARQFESHADDVTGAAADVVRAIGPDVVTGPVATTINLAVQASGANASRIAGQLRDLARTCRQRADVCRAYTRAVERYRRLLLVPTVPVLAPPPPPPRRPAPWAEAG